MCQSILFFPHFHDRKTQRDCAECRALLLGVKLLKFMRAKGEASRSEDGRETLIRVRISIFTHKRLRCSMNISKCRNPLAPTESS